MLELMKRNKVETLFKTSDGNLFVSKNVAENHAWRDVNGMKREKTLLIEPIEKSDLEKSEPEKKAE